MSEVSILFGDYLVSKDVISQEQLNEALKIQEKNKNQIGEILVHLNYLKISELNQYLKEHNANFISYQKKIAGLTNEQDSVPKNQKQIQQITETLSFDNWRDQLIAKVKDKFSHYNLSTGIIVLDIQHCWFITVLEYILLIVSDKNRKIQKEDMLMVCRELIDYGQRHFEVEESLIQLIKKDFEIHQIMHQKFITQQRAILARISDSSFSDPVKYKYMLNKMYEQTNEWFLSHIAIHDKTFALQIKKNSNKKQVLDQWINILKTKNLLEIKINEKVFYDDVIAKMSPENND